MKKSKLKPLFLALMALIMFTGTFSPSVTAAQDNLDAISPDAEERICQEADGNTPVENSNEDKTLLSNEDDKLSAPDSKENIEEESGNWVSVPSLKENDDELLVPQIDSPDLSEIETSMFSPNNTIDNPESDCSIQIHLKDEKNNPILPFDVDFNIFRYDPILQKIDIDDPIVDWSYDKGTLTILNLSKGFYRVHIVSYNPKYFNSQVYLTFELTKEQPHQETTHTFKFVKDNLGSIILNSYYQNTEPYDEVSFKLTYPDGTEKISTTNSGLSQVIFENLKPGDYTLEELNAPAPFKNVILKNITIDLEKSSYEYGCEHDYCKDGGGLGGSGGSVKFSGSVRSAGGGGGSSFEWPIFPVCENSIIVGKDLHLQIDHNLIQLNFKKIGMLSDKSKENLGTDYPKGIKAVFELQEFMFNAITNEYSMARSSKIETDENGDGSFYVRLPRFSDEMNFYKLIERAVDENYILSEKTIDIAVVSTNHSQTDPENQYHFSIWVRESDQNTFPCHHISPCPPNPPQQQQSKAGPIGAFPSIEDEIPLNWANLDSEQFVDLSEPEQNVPIIPNDENPFICGEVGKEIGISELEIPNIKKDGRLTIKKVGENNEPLKGAEFSLIDEDLNIIKVLTSNESGIVDFGVIPYGVYVLRETKAPDGYEPMEDRKVIIDSNVVIELTLTNEKTPPTTSPTTPPTTSPTTSPTTPPATSPTTPPATSPTKSSPLPKTGESFVPAIYSSLTVLSGSVLLLLEKLQRKK